jgi:glycosyltransferase involved in cell wall biosynthesis
VNRGEPLISVVICTRNRAVLLAKAIASVVLQDFSSQNYEIVVVDNGSSDHTREVVQSTRSEVAIRYIREDRTGLCYARNRGWREATGRYIVFFDDDAVARPGWLRRVQEAFEHAPTGVGVVGGRIDPIWGGDRPEWLADEIAGSLTIIDWGDAQKNIQDIRREWLAGANMAVPRAVLVEVGGFHPWLDRVGNNLLSSGDVFLQKQIMRRGYQCIYVPGMAIQHLVPPSRLHQKWFVRRFFWQGVSDAVMHLIEVVPSRTQRLRLALGKAARMFRSPRRLHALLLRTNRPEVFRTKCLALVDLGFIFGLLGAAKH